ncbi:MAG: PilZ domain-containing protein [Nitrospirae bacterium]|nr:PilZ domain-containing protein [Nitrospirota bacterium]
MENTPELKSITVYPSAVIPIVCPYCEAKGKITREYPPDKNFTISCPKCKQRFVVNINTRMFYRKNVNIEAHYQFRGSNKPERKGDILNMSRSGLCLKCNKPSFIPKEKVDVLSLRFKLPPREEPISIHCEVVNVIDETEKTITWGLKFKDLGEFEEMQIGFFLQP